MSLVPHLVSQKQPTAISAEIYLIGTKKNKKDFEINSLIEVTHLLVLFLK